jgi:membrane peptidoglycan carboxypeptidase
MAHAMGIRSELPPVCAITLGSVAVNPLEMTTGYATVADGGVRHDPTPFVQVKTPSGRVEQGVVPEPVQVLDPNDAALVTYALQKVVTEGTGTSAALTGFPVAGKTGTAKDNVDAWFCGYTVQLTTCVWVGYREGEIPLEDVEGVSSVFGATIPAAIWKSFMTTAMEGMTPEDFPTPSFEGHQIPPATPVYVAPSVSVCPFPLPSVPPGETAVCPTETPSPSESPSPSASPSPKPTRSAPPSPSPSPSRSPSPSHSPSPSPSPTKTTTQSPTPTSTSSPKARRRE